MVDLPFESVMGGVSLVARHDLNASDAAIMTAFLRYAAAREEGPRVLNPESIAAADVPAFLQSLA